MVSKHPELKLSVLPAIDKDSTEAVTNWYPLASKLTRGEKACAQSHIAAIRKVAESSGNPTDLHFIFEDDVELVPGFLEKFAKFYKPTFADGKLNFDILNLWRMPPRSTVATIGEHAVITDGFWGMQGYVVTPRSAKKLLDCLEKRFAQVDEMIGCCAGSAPEIATFNGGPLQKHSMRCVYKTPRPPGIKTNLDAIIVQPDLVIHLGKGGKFASTAHKN